MASEPFNARSIMVDLRESLDEDAHETALAILTNVVIDTPVGNPTRWQFPESAPAGYVGGHARRNWRVGIRSPDERIVGEEGKGPGEQGARSEAIQAGIAVIAKFNFEDRRLYIVNAVPYIGPLNNGHSTVAPANFVEKAVQVATARAPDGREVL